MTDSKIALVTGARRGVGAGIAGDLGSHGIVIYITGRSLNASDAIARAAYDKTCYRNRRLRIRNIQSVWRPRIKPP